MDEHISEVLFERFLRTEGYFAKYGAATVLKAEDGGRRIALHARELSFKHPTREEVISVVAPVPADWPAPTPRVDPGPTGRSTPGGRSGP